jgi:hypothetical protein
LLLDGHVLISLIGIVTGLVVAYGMLTAQRLEAWTFVFLSTTVLTSATGFLFHRTQILPSHIVSVISLVLLAIAIFAFYSGRLAGAWRWIYVVTALASLYLNLFVLVAQSFLKVPALHALAPKGSEPPFLAAQGAVFVLFLIVTALAVGRFRVPARA